MSATPNRIANEILMFPVREHKYFPKNRVKIIFNYGITLSKKKVTALEKQILTLVNEINVKTGKNVLLVTDNKSRLDTIIKNKNITVESYHPRDSQHAEGTTLEGFGYAIAINISHQNIVSVENQARIMAEVWDYETDTIKVMFQEISTAKVIQAMARTMPYEDHGETIIYILLDERFTYASDKIMEWLSPTYLPTVSMNKHTGITFQNIIETAFSGKKKKEILNAFKKVERKKVPTNNLKL